MKWEKNTYSNPSPQQLTRSCLPRHLPHRRRKACLSQTATLQARCKSCWAFSATGSLEGQHKKKTGKLVVLSEQNLVDCCTENFGCDGGYVSEAFKYIQRNNGINTESAYPYRARDGVCRFSEKLIGSTCKGFVELPKNDEDELKRAVALLGPISVCIDSSHHSFNEYQTGVYYEPICSSTHPTHCALVVGYGTESNEDYWLVKNSSGSSWGNRGYIKMARNRQNNCGIASEARYPLV